MSVASNARNKKSKSRKWEIMETPSIEEVTVHTEEERSEMSLPVGYCIRFFTHDMHHMYSIPSHCVKFTRGVVDHLQDYNQLGPNKSRNKLFLCSNFHAEKKCCNGSLCRELHSTLSIGDAVDAAKFFVPSNATGSPIVSVTISGADTETFRRNSSLSMNNSTAVDANLDNDSSPLDFLVPVSGGNELMNAVFLPEGLILRHSLHTRWTTRDMYPTLPNGVVFSIALPNTATPVEDFDSGVIFVTKGAEEYYNQVVSKEPTTVTMQHCAHYSKNGVCCYGNECQFVHVVHYTHKSRFDLDNSESDTDGASLGSSTTSDARKSNRGKRNKENPLSMLGGKSGKKSDSCNHSRTSSQGSGINTNVVPSPNGTPGTVFVPTGWPSQPNNNMGNVMPFNNNVQPFVNTGNPFVMMPTGTNPQMIFMPQQNPSQPPVYLMPFSYPNQ